MRTLTRRALPVLRRPAVAAGLLGLLVLLLLVTFPGLVTGHDPETQNLSARLVPPAWLDGGSTEHLLGTDHLGRDVAARTLYGGRVSLLVGFVAATAASVLGIALGLLAGYRGGWLERVVAEAANVWLAFPFLVLAIATVAVVGSDLTVLVVLLAIAAWVTPTSITRAATASLRGEDYVQAAIGMGASDGWILRRHVLRSVLAPNLVVWTLTVGTLVVIEGALSFLGLGVRPPTASWGNMLSDGRAYLETAWWLVAFPGVALTATVAFTNLLGDGLRDALDVRTESR